MAYMRIAFLALLAAAIAAALFYRGQAIKAASEAVQLRSDLALAESVNKQNQATIAVLRDDLRVSNALAADLAEQVEQIDRERDEALDQLNALRESDAAVKEYLETPVPEALRKRYVR